FRGELIKSLIRQQYVVSTASSPATEQEKEKIETLGATHHDIDLHRNGLNPLSDLKTFWQLKSLFHALQPNIILAYTIKPVIWGGLAARFFSNARFIALITGLGFAFQGDGLFRNLLAFLVSA